jgi:RND family efflux transporter MFP subunit
MTNFPSTLAGQGTTPLRVSRWPANPRLRPWLCLLGLAAASSLHAEPPTVAVGTVTRGEGSREVSFNAELRPYREIEVHAKVTGYIDDLKVDVGDSVKEGDMIASLDIPETKIELEHALAEQRKSYAEVERATAVYGETHLTLTRLSATDRAQPHLIAAQELDTAKAKERTAAATLDSVKEQSKVAEAEVKRLSTMVNYGQITAPFSGVITKRNADVGSLIQAGTSSGSMPVVRLSQNDKLRVVFPVSISFVSNIRVGDPVEIRLPGSERTLQGAVARFTRKVETSTRTMDAEVDLPNPDLTLIPGIYATVLLKMEHRDNALFVPVESVLRNQAGSSLYVVNADNRVEERNVTLGLETPTKVEVVSGVREHEKVLMGSRTQFTPGQSVAPRVVQPMRMN